MRPMTKADIPAWNRLLADIEEVERSGEHYNEADLAEEMDNPDIELGKDMVAAFDGEQMVGYFSVYPRAAGAQCHKIMLEGAVHPQWRGQGVGTRLARAMMDRAEQVHAEQHPDVPVGYALSGRSSDHEQADLLAGLGLRPERWTFLMRAKLDEVAVPPPLPDGFLLKRYETTMAADLLAAHNAAFDDSPLFTSWSEGMWKQWVTESRAFRPEHSFVLLDETAPTKIAAYVQTSEFDAYYEMTGRREAYVAKVGTLAAYRGRGLASTLLGHALVAYREACYEEASLDVDSENPTGALGIYQRAGFVVESKRTDYSLTTT